jgi:hypothetical protein
MFARPDYHQLRAKNGAVLRGLLSRALAYIGSKMVRGCCKLSRSAEESGLEIRDPPECYPIVKYGA